MWTCQAPSDDCSDVFACVITTIRRATALHVVDAASGQTATENVVTNVAFDVTMTVRARSTGERALSNLVINPKGVAWRLGDGLANYHRGVGAALPDQPINTSWRSIRNREAVLTSAVPLPPKGFPIEGGVMENDGGLGIRIKNVPTEASG